MLQLLWLMGRSAAMIFESYPEVVAADRTTGTLFCEDDGVLRYLPQPRSEAAGHDDIGIYGSWENEIFSPDPDNYWDQCMDHPHCLQPSGHEEDPELLAIVGDASYEQRMQDVREGYGNGS